MACKNDPDWNTIIEPESTSNMDNRSSYPYLNLYASELHSLEMDDSPGNERIRLQHGNPDSSVSTFLEIHPDGTEVHKIYGDGYEIVTCNKKVLVKGSCTIAVDGNAAIEVKGNAWSTVKGNYSSVIEGNANIVSKKSINISADKEIVLAADQITLKAEQINSVGDLQLQGDLGMNETTYISGNLNVDGSVFAASGLLTPGSLVVGPLATVTPNKGMIFPLNFAVIDVGVGITMKAAVGISALAGAAIDMKALGSFSADAGGKASLSALGVTTVSGAGGVSVSSLGVIGVTAVGVVTIGASAISLKTAIVTATGLFNVAGVVTAADYFCLANPTFYSAHLHGTLVGPTTPPVPGT
jgi:hypothetical protein